MPTFYDLPGEKGLPLIGHTVNMLRDPVKFADDMTAKYGNLYRSRAFFKDIVHLVGPEANEFLLLDEDSALSSEKGWGPYLGRLFSRGLMLLDFDEHRDHKKIMASAFMRKQMIGYLSSVNEIVERRLVLWGEQGQLKFFPSLKQLSLDIATETFFGLRNELSETKKVNQALTDLIRASLAVIPWAIPGSALGRGVKSRKYLEDFIFSIIPARRQGKGRTDLLSVLCQASDETGNQFTDQEVVDHMIFMWMASHDTVTSSLTTLIYYLAKNPVWQDRIRDQIDELGLNGNALSYDCLNKLKVMEASFKEALRLNPPVTGILRKTTKSVNFEGKEIPKDTLVSINTIATHRCKDTWQNPLEFDPERFLGGNSRALNRYSWVPFGAGAHTCIGMQFAYLEAKSLLYQLLSKYEISVASGYKADFQILPLVKPKDGLPVQLKTIK